jgi:hypothetical protein
MQQELQMTFGINAPFKRGQEGSQEWEWTGDQMPSDLLLVQDSLAWEEGLGRRLWVGEFFLQVQDKILGDDNCANCALECRGNG